MEGGGEIGVGKWRAREMGRWGGREKGKTNSSIRNSDFGKSHGSIPPRRTGKSEDEYTSE